MLISCLKQVKNFIPKFSISGILFSEKKMNLYTIILVSFPSSECVDEVIDIRANYQGYGYVMFISFSIIHRQSYI